MGEGTVVCSENFRAEDMDCTSLSCVRVRDGAVPIIFKSFPSYLQKDKKIRKAPASRPPPPIPQVICDEHEDVESKSDLDSSEKASSKRKLLVNEDRLQSYRKKIRTLSQCKRRLVKRNASLKKNLVDLKNKNMISSNSLDILEKCSGGISDLLKRNAAKFNNSSVPVRYSPELRAFALTLHFYSPRAYKYVRKMFNTCLPYSKTISNWYKNVDGKPGFTQSAFALLESKVQLAKTTGNLVPCSLVMDEMAIRQHVEWDGTKHHGHVDLGTEMDDDSLPVAKEALTFMVVSLKESWKLPVAYFLIDGLSGIEKRI